MNEKFMATYIEQQALSAQDEFERFLDSLSEMDVDALDILLTNMQTSVSNRAHSRRKVVVNLGIQVVQQHMVEE